MGEETSRVTKKEGAKSEGARDCNAFGLEAAHIFKISGGKIHEIEAMGFSLPLYSKNGWSPFTK